MWSVARHGQEGESIFDPRPKADTLPAAFVVGSQYFCLILEDILISDHFRFGAELKSELVRLHTLKDQAAKTYSMEAE